MNPVVYYSLVALTGLLVLTPLAALALQTRRAAALRLQPVAVGWDLPAFAGLDRDRLRMYRLHPAGESRYATHEIRDDTGKRIGRIEFPPYEPARVDLNGREFRVFDQGSKRHGPLWRGKVGGEAKNSIVLHTEGKPIAEIFRESNFLRAAWQSLSFSRGSVEIKVPARRLKHPLEFLYDHRTVARVVRPDPTGIAGIRYVAIAANAYPEFVAGVLYLASQKRR